MVFTKAICDTILIILIYFAAYALINRICNCVERCWWIKYRMNGEEWDDEK